MTTISHEVGTGEGPAENTIPDRAAVDESRPLWRRRGVLAAGGAVVVSLLAAAAGLKLRSPGRAGDADGGGGAWSPEVDAAMAERLDPAMRNINQRILGSLSTIPVQRDGGPLYRIVDPQAGTVTFKGIVNRQNESYGMTVVMGLGEGNQPNPDDPRYIDLTHMVQGQGEQVALTDVKMANDTGRQYGAEHTLGWNGWFAGYVDGVISDTTPYVSSDLAQPDGRTPVQVAAQAAQIADSTLPRILSAFQRP